MHVLQFGPIPPPHGGVQTHLMALRGFLRSRGHRVSAINITRHRKANGDDIYNPRSGLGVLRQVLALRPDLMHIHLGGHLSRRDLSLLLALTLLPRARVVFTFHSGGFPGSPAGRSATPLSWPGFVLQRLHGLIGVNAEIRELFHRFGVSPDRTAMIEPHAMGAELRGLGDVDLPRALLAFAETHDPFLLTVGLLEPEYSLELQIDSLPRIRERHPRAGLAIIGSGSSARALRERVAASPVAADLLLCGDVPHRGTLAAIARARAMLRPTQYDGDSISVREALALGTPVITSDNGMRPAGVRLLRNLQIPELVEAVELVLAEERGPASSADGAENLALVLRFYEQVLEGAGSRL